ncbi:MAG: mismatch repair protein [Acidobacteriota bacterium]|nr:mismatch repair protein [Acidobacteriota bacterium]
MAPIAPVDEYSRRLAVRQAAAAARERTHIHLGNAKVATFIGALIYGAVTLGGDPSVMVFAAAAAAYLALAVWHELTIRALTRAQAAVRFYMDGTARIEDRWIGTGATGERFRDGRHPYADDLDVFGSGSLFQLVSGARTPMGEERLAAWLSSAAAISEIRERQSRIAGLRTRIDLRERIAVVNAGARRRIAPAPLIAWAEAAPSMPALLRPVIVLLALAFAGAVIVMLRGGSGWPIAFLLPIDLALLWWLARRANAIVEGLSSATESAGLDLLSRVICEIEREPFDDAAVVALAARLKATGDGVAASRGIATLARVSDWADSRHNVFARLLEIPALFTVQVAYAAQSWRSRHGRAVRDWVDAVGEMEALLSLSGYSYEHPADPFPELLEPGDEGASFDGADLAHPLLPRATAVSNSVGLGPSSPRAPFDSADSASGVSFAQGRLKPSRPTRILIVSGSNMSGKSTLMRTVGLNAVLALAGAPVRASRLRLTPLAVGTCLRHTDSLHEGRSGFYTEVLRIRLICDLLDGPRPVLFLFDELLSGTNSKDRRIAAEGLVRMMLARRAIGMVTTHDLALTEIAAIFPGQVRNVHLQDHVEDGQMRFDYKLRDGIITHSNALELMRMIGLDV